MIKILDFWAGWCYPCKIMEPVLSEVEKELAGKATIEKINIDENPQKSQEFGVMSIPTYVILKGDKEVDRLIGATSKDSFLKFLEKHLAS